MGIFWRHQILYRQGRTHRIAVGAVVLLSLLFTLQLSAQTQPETDRFNQQRILINQGGMGVLGGWSLANFTVGGYGWATTSGKEQYFHGMNVMWNVVNAAISFPALIKHTRMDLSGKSWAEVQAENRKNEKVFLINGGLDILYMGTGAALIGVADQTQNKELFQGFGESFILQGAFLFVFDLGMWAILRGHRRGHEKKWTQKLGVVPGGIRYRIG